MAGQQVMAGVLSAAQKAEVERLTALNETKRSTGSPRSEVERIVAKHLTQGTKP